MDTPSYEIVKKIILLAAAADQSRPPHGLKPPSSDPEAMRDTTEESELLRYLDSLSEQQQRQVMALCWFGRGDNESYQEAWQAARYVNVHDIPSYLVDKSPLHEYLENGLRLLRLSETATAPLNSEAVSRLWNENPFQSMELTPLVTMAEGPDVLLSALVTVAPDFVLDLETTGLPDLMEAVWRACPHWFPAGDEWHTNAYAMIKERLIEHDVPLNTLTSNAAVGWLKQQGLKTAPVGEIYQSLNG